MSWFAPYLNRLVGFVVETKRGEFLPIIGRCCESEGDDDCFINVVAKNAKQPSLDEALALLDAEKDKLHRIFRQPEKPSGGMGAHWLGPLVVREGEEHA
jgi:hypothetical protein